MMILGAAMVPSIVPVSWCNLGRTLDVGVVAEQSECSGSNGTRHNHTQPSRFIFTNAEKIQPGSAEKTTEAASWPLRRGLRHTCESGGGEGRSVLQAGPFLATVTRPPTPEGDEEKESEPTLQEIINVKLIESGEKERLKELLRERLVECGWRDELKAQCRAYTRKRGRENITVDELVRTITPRGRATVPDNVKAELLQRIRVFLMSDAL